MKILKTLNTPNGMSAAMHIPVRAEITLATGALCVSVNSYTSADVSPEITPIMWQWRVDLNVSDLVHDDMVRAMYQALVTVAESPFVGGVVSDDSGDDLALAKTARIAYLNAQCQSQIYAGFYSIALGTMHHYPAGDKDQTNLIASVLASTLPGNPDDWTTPFWCATGSEPAMEWGFAQHTASQIQEVGNTGKLAILTAMANNEQKRVAVEAATTVTEVNEVNW